MDHCVGGTSAKSMGLAGPKHAPHLLQRQHLLSILALTLAVPSSPASSTTLPSTAVAAAVATPRGRSRGLRSCCFGAHSATAALRLHPGQGMGDGVANAAERPWLLRATPCPQLLTAAIIQRTEGLQWPSLWNEGHMTCSTQVRVRLCVWVAAKQTQSERA
eukprot:231598-Pelagomonas_calceolata.AAC.6